MKPKLLSTNKIYRRGSKVQESRTSIDFVIDGKSLVEMLDEASGDRSDLMGCFVKGFEEENKNVLSLLRCESTSEVETGRVLLYICPECGDIGCGSYAAIIEKVNDQYIWHSFAYENGYEEPMLIDTVGPFYFNINNYESVLNEAAGI